MGGRVKKPRQQVPSTLRFGFLTCGIIAARNFCEKMKDLRAVRIPLNLIVRLLMMFVVLLVLSNSHDHAVAAENGWSNVEEKVVDAELKKILPLIKDARYLKEVRVFQAELVTREARNMNKDEYGLEDVESHGFYMDVPNGRLEIARVDLALIRGVGLDYLKKNAEGLDLMAPADSYHVACDPNDKPLCLISVWPGRQASVSRILAFTPGIYQNHPGDPPLVNFMISDLLKETLFSR